MSELIVRIAARGDGVTASGRHVAFGVPGDTLADDGVLTAGPRHQLPPCRHFPECGGCQLQHVDDAAYRDYLGARVLGALAQHGVETDIRDPHLSPPRSRRRATLRAMRVGQGAILGFNQAQSNRIVDMHECHVLRPELFALVAPLRALLGRLVAPKRVIELHMTLADQGVDLLLKGLSADTLDAKLDLIDFAQAQGLARLSLDGGLGPETAWEPEPATITLARVPVRLPPGAFLQATADGEAALVGAVGEAVAGAGAIADLFAGLGTFALAVRAGYAAEAARDVAAALRQASPLTKVEHRDLYRRPLDPEELANFDAVILDPPRSGAEEQVRALAASRVARIAYVSCNPATFARDSALLVGGGYTLEWARPVGQFRWSTHIELAACFSR
ncbi:MAG: class I SAM-dependent RNA methyltransferase [Sphingomicrobium sp.]